MRHPLPRVVLIVALMLVPSASLATPPTTPLPAALPAAPLPGDLDVTFALTQLQAGRLGALDALAPLATGARPKVPRELLAGVLAPPPLVETLAALGAPAAPMALPPDVAGAVSSLGQGVLGAQQLALAGRQVDAAALVLAAIDHVRPTLERHAVILAHPEAFGPTSRDEAYARAHLAAIVDAGDAEAALVAMGIVRQPAPPARALSEELGALYAHLGLPLTLRDRAALAAADSLDPDLRGPLATALSHVNAAALHQREATAVLDEADLAALSDTAAVQRALATTSPTPGDVALLAAYGGAVQRLDAAQMRTAQGHLLSASDVLSSMPRLPATPFTGTSGQEDGHLRAAAGGLVAEVQGGRSTTSLRIADGGSAWSIPAGSVRFDETRGQLVVFEDLDGDAVVDPGEARFVTPALARPEDDVLFMDPYRLVVVTGTGRTYTGPDGGRLVVVETPVRSGRAPGGLEAFDELLRNETIAWPFVSPETRRMMEDTGDLTPSGRLAVRVNPQSYQVLHWDLGGDDIYATNAAGAGEAGLLTFLDRTPPLSANATREPLPASILVDLDGHDRYETWDAHTIAGANRSVALLVDVAGSDRYSHGGEADAIASSTAGGVAVLLDAGGRDAYAAGSRAVGHARSAGVALLVDAWGRDTYDARNDSLAATDLGRDALLLDVEGDDAYTSRNLTQAASRGGLAVLVDRAGNDTYRAVLSTSQGYAEPSGPGACVASGACAGTSFVARLSAFLDMGGHDDGACAQGLARNEAVGRVGLARPLAPTGAHEPSFGACLDVDASPQPEGHGGLVSIPPTYFTTSAGNLTVPGIVRVGTLGDDHVAGWYALQVDLNGNDTYERGAASRSNATRLAGTPNDAGEVGPVAVLLDVDGDNVFDGTRHADGAFSHASGGVAIQALLSTRRAPAERHLPRDASGAYGPDLGNETFGIQAENASSRDRLVAPYAENRFFNVTVGLASAEEHGVAVHLSSGYRTNVSALDAASARASCRLACARSGGLALIVSEGGPGDLIEATPLSLGAVEGGPLGGAALYARRGPADVYRGSNDSMGVVRVNASSLGPPTRPSVALFVKDGFAMDEYAGAMRKPGVERRPRGNDLAWEDNETFSTWSSTSTAPVLARGIDNLDWYLHMNAATAERGLAPGIGPGSPFHPGGAWTAGGTAAWQAWWSSPTTVATNRSAAIGDAANATLRGDPTAILPVRVPLADHGDGRSSTGPHGLRPVTLARTGLSPIVNVTEVKSAGPAVPPSKVPFLAGSAEFTFHVRNPPTYADETYGSGVVRDGSATDRVELVVRGTSARWAGCPWPELRDPLDSEACLLVSWQRNIHGEGPASTPDRGSILRRDLANWTVMFNAVARGPDGLPAFPPAPYAVTLRAYAARTTTTSTPLFPGDAVIEALASDAVNHTDDAYGHYGSAYHLAVPIYNPPLRLGASSIQDANATAPLRYAMTVTEPSRWWANLTTRPPAGSAEPPRRVASLTGTSTRFGQPEAFFENGSDVVAFEWDAAAESPGAFMLTVHLVGEFSRQRAAFSDGTVYKDVEPPIGGGDSRGIPGVIGADAAPDGVLWLPMVRESRPDAFTGSRVHLAHLWSREALLDAADGSSVLQQGNWSYAGEVRSLGSIEIPPEVEPPTEATDWISVPFQAPTLRGPPRAYEFVLVPEDRAGNRVLDDPAAHEPVCDASCIRLVYDITPPRTRADLLTPPPELARVREGEIRFAVDASESPDTARVDAFHTLVAPDAPADLGSALLGRPLDALPSRPPNVTLLPGEPLLHGDGLVRTNASFSVRLNLTAKDQFNEDTPLWLALEITGGREAAADRPLLVDATNLTVRGASILLDVPDLIAPAAPGVYVLEARVVPPEQGWNVTANVLRVPIVVWGTVDASRGEGRVPVPADASHGSQLFVLVRGADRVGNVEPAVDYDLRVEVDRAAPALVAPPNVVLRSDGVTLEFVSDEPTEAILSIEGFPDTTNALESAHLLLVEGLDAGATYEYELRLRDAVGNDGEPIRGSFTTLRAAEIHIEPPPVAAASPFEFGWSVRNATATLEHRVLLSLDGGGTFPHELLKPTVLPAEAGTVRRVMIHPDAWPETRAAVVRVEVRAAGSPVVLDSPTFVLDGHAPRVRLEPGAGVDAYAARAATLRANATDEGSGLARVEWSLDNVSFHDAAEPFAVQGDTPREIHLRARDAAGNVRTLPPFLALLDGGEPRVEASSRVRAATGAVVVRLEARDELAGLARVRAADDGGWNLTLPADAFVDGRADLIWPLTGPEGARALDIVAEDAAGNTAQARVHVRLDRTPPTVRAAIVDRASRSMTLVLESGENVTAEIELSGAGVARVLDVEATSGAPLRIELPGLVPARSYDVRARLRDEAGNVERVHIAASTLADRVPPGKVEGVLATSTRAGVLAVRWDTARDDDVVESYHVFRRSAGGEWVLAGVTSGVVLVDTGAPLGGAVEYAVRAIDRSGNVGPASEPTAAERRTAPAFEEVTARARDGVALVTVRLADADGDMPQVSLVLDGASVEIPLRREGGSWLGSVETRVMEGPAAPRAFHLVASDGRFETREPPSGARVIPHEEPGEEAGGIPFLSVRPVPAAGLFGLVLAALAAVLWRARR